MKIYRHGDVLIKETKRPEKAKEVKRGKELTVALGERTGHHHTLYGSIPDAVIEYGFNDRKYVEVQEELELKHQEHKMLKIPPGEYEIIIEKEKDYFSNIIRQVRD